MMLSLTLLLDHSRLWNPPTMLEGFFWVAMLTDDCRLANLYTQIRIIFSHANDAKRYLPFNETTNEEIQYTRLSKYRTQFIDIS